MRARLRSWWQYIRKHRIVAIIIAFVIAAMVLIFVESLIYGTGFNGYYTTSTTRTISRSPPIITRTETYQPGKTLWDWFQLLIIPSVLAIAGYTINLTISRSEQESTRLRDQTEHEIAADNQRGVALQGYIDKMSELLLHENLLKSEPVAEARDIAQLRTKTVLRGLDPMRKGIVLQFLRDSGLIYKDGPIVNDLIRADLREAELPGAFLERTNLVGVNLRRANLEQAYLENTELIDADLMEANLSYAILFDADLREANLEGANLTNASLDGTDLWRANLKRANLMGANLERANLEWANLDKAQVTDEQLAKAKSLKDAIMPDGSKHQ